MDIPKYPIFGILWLVGVPQKVVRFFNVRRHLTACLGFLRVKKVWETLAGKEVDKFWLTTALYLWQQMSRGKNSFMDGLIAVQTI